MVCDLTDSHHLGAWKSAEQEATFAFDPGVLKFDTAGTVGWKADEAGFAMPVRVGSKDHWEIVQPTTEWKTLASPLGKGDFQVATDLYFVNVDKQ
jgi:hypothetical protein